MTALQFIRIDGDRANGFATAAFVLRIEPVPVSTKGFNRLSQGGLA